MSYTLGTAAKATGLHKATIHRAIKGGKLSAERQADGSYRIDPSELARVFTLLSATGSGDTQNPAASDDPQPKGATAEPARDGGAVLVAELRVRAEMAEALRIKEAEERARERAMAEETIADLRKRLDVAEERVRGLLPRPSQETAAPVATPATVAPAPRPGLLARLLGRSA